MNSQQRFLEQVEARRLAPPSLPTDVLQINSWFKELGEPIVLFGETIGDRRERLGLEIGKRGGLAMLPRLAAAHAEWLNSNTLSKEKEKEKFTSGKWSGGEAVVNLKKSVTEYWWSNRLGTRQSTSEYLCNKLELCAANAVGSRPSTCISTSQLSTIAVGDRGGMISLLRGNLEIEKEIQTDSLGISCVSYNCDRLLYCGFDGKLSCFNSDLSETKYNSNLNGRLYQCSWHPSGEYFVACSGEGTWSQWNLNSSSPLYTHRGHQPDLGIRSISVDPVGGALVSSGGGDGVMRIWDTRLGRCIMTGSEHVQPVTCCLFMDIIVVTGAMDNMVKGWDMRRPAGSLYTLPAHSSSVTSLASNYDNNVFYSCALDGIIKGWSANGTLFHSSSVSMIEPVKLAGLHYTSGSIVSCSFDKTVRLWKLNK